MKDCQLSGTLAARFPTFYEWPPDVELSCCQDPWMPVFLPVYFWWRAVLLSGSLAAGFPTCLWMTARWRAVLLSGSLAARFLYPEASNSVTTVVFPSEVALNNQNNKELNNIVFSLPIMCNSNAAGNNNKWILLQYFERKNPRNYSLLILRSFAL